MNEFQSNPPVRSGPFRLAPSSDCQRVLVTDFDGTLTDVDFYQMFIDHFASPGSLEFWTDYEAGRITHFQAMARMYASAAPGEKALLAELPSLKLDPGLQDALKLLGRFGWGLVVVSAGCRWYIDKLLHDAGVELEVHANPGHWEDGRLILDWPSASRFQCEDTGIDKSAVVQSLLAECDEVAFVGDGLPDLAPALLVPGRLRFARGQLATELTRLGKQFQPFSRWTQVCRQLCDPAR